jgi:hypothetical protein
MDPPEFCPLPKAGGFPVGRPRGEVWNEAGLNGTCVVAGRRRSRCGIPRVRCVVLGHPRYTVGGCGCEDISGRRRVEYRYMHSGAEGLGADVPLVGGLTEHQPRALASDASPSDALVFISSTHWVLRIGPAGSSHTTTPARPGSAASLSVLLPPRVLVCARWLCDRLGRCR